jgi:hypothetical protein
MEVTMSNGTPKFDKLTEFLAYLSVNTEGGTYYGLAVQIGQLATKAELTEAEKRELDRLWSRLDEDYLKPLLASKKWSFLKDAISHNTNKPVDDEIFYNEQINQLTAKFDNFANKWALRDKKR